MICTGCGHPIDETTVKEEAPAWIAETIVCNGCAVTERKRAADNDGNAKPPPGTRYSSRNRAHDRR